MSKFCTVMRAASCIAGKPRAIVLATIQLRDDEPVVIGKAVIVDNKVATQSGILPLTATPNDTPHIMEVLREFSTVVEVVRQESENAWAHPDGTPKLVYQVADNQEKTLWRDTDEDEYNRTGIIWRRVAYVQPKPDPVGNLPEPVLDWYAAEVARRDAVRVYNERLAYVKKIQDAGNWPGPDVNPEYQAMEAARKVAMNLLAPMYEALAASLPATK